MIFRRSRQSIRLPVNSCASDAFPPHTHARVVTVHSLSKTDCLAGARLSVVEIREPDLRGRFRRVSAAILPNVGALLLGYLLYRNPREELRAYWRLRNAIFAERMDAITTAFRNLPADRNPFGIEVIPPTGSMYPVLHIHNLPRAFRWTGSPPGWPVRESA